MRLYQWLALATSFGGAAVMACASGVVADAVARSAPLDSWAWRRWRDWWPSLAYGVDLPASNRRFSRFA